MTGVSAAGLLALWSAAHAVTSERTYVGELEGRPCLRVRESVRAAPDGTRTVEVETLLTVERPSRATVRQLATFVESAGGALTSFRIESASGEDSALAYGAVQTERGAKTVHGFVDRNGRRQRITRAVAENLPLLGPLGERRHLLAALTPGPVGAYLSPALRGGDLVLVAHRAERVRSEDGDGRRTFDVTSSATASPARITLDDAGNLIETEWRFGGIRARLAPAAPSTASVGAWAPRLRVAHRGPAPLPARQARFRLPAGLEPAIVEDEFQRRAGGGALLVTSGDQDVDAFHRRVAGKVSPLDLASADCTEASDRMARALVQAGVAVRVEIGLLFDTTTGHWQGHAWTSAYDPDAAGWVHLDPLYSDLPRSVYIKLGSGASVADAVSRSRLLEVVGSPSLGPIRRID